MRKFLAPSVFCLGTLAANAGEITSAYTKFDLEACRLVEKGDEYVYAGTWACPGYGGIDIIQASSDDRSYAAFGKEGWKHCAFRKTFGPFNTALSPVEWRIRDGVAFAAIERWSVADGDTGKSVTWLVVNALRDGESCHVHYIAGSYPNANQHARRAADDMVPDFDCKFDTPTVDSKVGEPPIAMIACRELTQE